MDRAIAETRYWHRTAQPLPARVAGAVVRHGRLQPGLPVLSLLPAMLGFSGRAIDRLHLPGLLQSPAPGTKRGLWWRWSRTVQRRPVLCGSAALVVLAALAISLFSMRLAFTDAGNDPATLTTRQAYDLVSAGFGPGFNGPLVLAAELPGRTRDRAAVTAVEHRLAAVPDVAGVQAPALQPGR